MSISKRLSRRVLISMVVSLIILFAVAIPAFACLPGAYAPSSITERIDEAPIVMIGRVVEMDFDYDDTESVSATILVSSYLKGEGYDLVTFDAIGIVWCPTGVRTGTEYFFFAQEDENGKVVVQHQGFPIAEQTSAALIAEAIKYTGGTTKPIRTVSFTQFAGYWLKGHIVVSFLAMLVFVAAIIQIVKFIGRNDAKAKGKRSI